MFADALLYTKTKENYAYFERLLCTGLYVACELKLV